MNRDSFVSLFNGQELDVDVSFHLAMAGLLEKDGNLWEHEKTGEKYVFTLSPSNHIIRIEKLIDRELITLTYSSIQEFEEEKYEDFFEMTFKNKNAFFLAVFFIIGAEPVGVAAFFNAMGKAKKRFPELYEAFTEHIGTSIDNPKFFDWFVENCPNNKNGRFSRLMKYKGDRISLEEREEMIIGRDGCYYYLIPYDLSIKHDIYFYIMMFYNIMMYKKLFDDIK